MATLVLTRKSEYMNRLRDYGVYLDGKKIGTIANGETKEFQVPAGQHAVVAKIDWCSSRTVRFAIGDEEVAHFEVGGFKNAGWLIAFGMVLFVLHYALRSTYGADYLFYLAVPCFLFLLYYVTLGRKRYLTLTETSSGQEEHMALQ